MSNARKLALDGVWRNNPALVQLLGLCPLLAVSQTLVTSLTLGLITLAVLVGANTLISLLKRTLVDTVRLPLQILVIATMVSAADLLMQTYFFELYQRIGLFIALIVTNCTILGRAELFARRNPIMASMADGFWMGLGFLWAITLLGGLREVIGRGTLFDGMAQLLGPSGDAWRIEVHESPILIMMLAPGAFLALGCLFALKNCLDEYYESRKTDRLLEHPAPRESNPNH
jgi:electron transport complex protein RnfE